MIVADGSEGLRKRSASGAASPDRPQQDDILPAHVLRLRDQERVDLIMSFYRGLRDFRVISRRSHAVTHGFHYDEMDHIIESYFRQVKDSCHRLFRQSKRSETDRLLQAVFDVYFGILFHILLKAKENLRLRENYNIQRLERLVGQIRAMRRLSELPPGVVEVFNRLVVGLRRDSKELAGEMAGARYILGQLERIFNRIIQVYGDNARIIRSLYCQRDLFESVFPGQGVDRLFSQIYRSNGPAEAYVFLGFDFLRSGHDAHAQEAFSRAIRVTRQGHLPPKRLRELYNQYRDRMLASLSGPGDAALAFRLRLREIEDLPLLRILVRDHLAKARGRAALRDSAKAATRRSQSL